MSRKKPKAPTEDDSVIAARDRQILDLAKIDEEENRRIKQMRSVSRGLRAFRGMRGASTAAASGQSRSGGGSAGGDASIFTGYAGYEPY